MSLTSLPLNQIDDVLCCDRMDCGRLARYSKLMAWGAVLLCPKHAKEEKATDTIPAQPRLRLNPRCPACGAKDRGKIVPASADGFEVVCAHCGLSSPTVKYPEYNRKGLTFKQMERVLRRKLILWWNNQAGDTPARLWLEPQEVKDLGRALEWALKTSRRIHKLHVAINGKESKLTPEQRQFRLSLNRLLERLNSQEQSHGPEKARQ